MNGFVAANDGNISVKVSENEYYCTPTGVSKGFMTPDMIIKIDADGNKLEGKLNPSSEIKMHMRVYRERPDVNAVVHAHPPTATAYAVAGIPLDKYLLPEAILVLGDVPICKYGTPSTMEIPDSLEPYIQTHDAFLLQNHGALTVGTSAQENAPAGVGIGPQQGGEKLCFHWKASFLLQQFLPLSVVRKHPL